MSFNLNQFLEENKVSGGGGKFDVLPMKIEAGFGVFAGKDSRLFPLKTNDEESVKETKTEAEAYLKEKGGNGFITSAVEQVWYTTRLLTRDPFKADWTEMKRPLSIPGGDGEFREAGDWVLFKSQWTGDNPVIDPDTHFGKELWVKSAMRPHPDFDKDNPNKYTTQLDRDATAAAGGTEHWVKNDDGELIPTFLRVVTHVFASEEEARAFVADGDDGVPSGNLHLEKELGDLMPDNWTDVFDEDAWSDIAKELFNSFHEGAKVGELASEWEGSVDKPTLMKIAKLTKTYPPL